MKGIEMKKNKYTAIIKLDKMLTENNIPHYMMQHLDGYIVEYYTPSGIRRGDAIEHQCSYGHKYDLLEVAGFGLSEPKANVSVEEAFNMFKTLHEEVMKNERKKSYENQRY